MQLPCVRNVHDVQKFEAARDTLSSQRRPRAHTERMKAFLVCNFSVGQHMCTLPSYVSGRDRGLSAFPPPQARGQQHLHGGHCGGAVWHPQRGQVSRNCCTQLELANACSFARDTSFLRAGSFANTILRLLISVRASVRRAWLDTTLGRCAPAVPRLYRYLGHRSERSVQM